MNRKYLITTLAVFASSIIIIAAMLPAFATPATNIEYAYGKSGTVVLNLPEGGKCNKTDIKFTFMHVDARSTKGAEDYIEVSVWHAAGSRFLPVGFIDDNPVALASLGQMLAGYPFIKLIQVAPNELEVWSEGDTMYVNLTRSVDIVMSGLDGTPYAGMKALNFTLPALTATFVKTGPIYEKTESKSTYPSGWVGYGSKHIAPAFVSIGIPTWLGTTTLPVVGYFNVKHDIMAVKP